MSFTEEEIFNQLKTIFIDFFKLKPDSITMESRLYEDLDLDSIDAIDLLAKMQETTGRKIDPSQFREVRTIKDIVEVIKKESN